ncbi:uncharacterized protein LOC125499535 [Beta vulgaris subsp. vulgaris]|uniref:uncharacterized protein LOC125499535 n=1 Tax=Beta vulgaris subsp. vulgaris TaxID=3555 RepID=UPI0025483116|nr:uncharacterized protein LOC125499535 [Beta vulgaris subsp. vulgaris]
MCICAHECSSAATIPIGLRRRHSMGRLKKLEVAHRPLTSTEVYNQVKGIETFIGKPTSEVDRPTGLWNKQSIFWKLPYWKDLKVKNCLDVMHIEKNVCEAILATLMNIPGKTKDVKASRLYLEKQGLRPELWAQKRDGRKKKIVEERVDDETHKSKNKVEDSEKNYLPPACYTISRAEKRIFCESLYGIKVPTGYSSNMKRFVTLNGELKLSSMKSHDCHVMIQVFLLIAIRGILPKHVRHTIKELCSFFHTICSKVQESSTLDSLQARVVETLCKFEMYSPPAFFDIMVHLIVHIVREIKLCGLVFLRWCYPFERFMGTLKDKVSNNKMDLHVGITS